MALGGWAFSVLPAEVDETPLPGEKPYPYVRRMAEAKAQAIALQVSKDALVIGADTIVVDRRAGGLPGDLEILGKPVDAADAFRMLVRLRGHSHQVYTAVAMLRVADGRLESDVCTTDVPMRNYTDEEIVTYIATGDPLDKAGAYAIQHAGFHPVEHLQGCYANVVGLPACSLARLLGKFGARPGIDIPLGCQAELNYQCSICMQLVNGAVQS